MTFADYDLVPSAPGARRLELWRVVLLGGRMTSTLTFFSADEPEDRALAALTTEYGAGAAHVLRPGVAA